MTTNGQKWPKNRVFGLFKKIASLVLSGICVKRKFLGFINILGEWPSGLRRCDQNSNPTRRLAGLKDPNSLQGFR